MVPEFNQGRFGAGIVRGTDAVMRRIEERAARMAPPRPGPAPGAEDEDGGLSSLLCVGLVLIAIVIVFMTGRRGSKRSKP